MLRCPAGRPAPSSAPPTRTYGHVVESRGQAWRHEPLDRLAAVAGGLAVEVVPGEGTRVRGSVPLR